MKFFREAFLLYVVTLLRYADLNVCDKQVELMWNTLRKGVLMACLLLQAGSVMAESHAWDKVKPEAVRSWSAITQGSKEAWAEVKESSKEASKEVKKSSKSVWQSVKELFR